MKTNILYILLIVCIQNVMAQGGQITFVVTVSGGNQYTVVGAPVNGTPPTNVLGTFSINPTLKIPFPAQGAPVVVNTTVNNGVTSAEQLSFDDLYDRTLNAIVSGDMDFKIKMGILKMESYAGTAYKKEAGELRIGESAESLEFMDCSEFVARYLQTIGIATPRTSFNTSGMTSERVFRDSIKRYGGIDYKVSYVLGSNFKGFTDIREGDIFVWKKDNGDGHTGIVKSFDAATRRVVIVEAIGTHWPCSSDLALNSGRECGKVVQSTYNADGNSLAGHAGWIGYYRIVK